MRKGEKMRVADYIIQKIYEEGIKYIYTVTGRGILYLTDAVARNSNIKCIPVHHEQSASFASIAYAKCSGNMGACLVSTGCAATNAITGVLCAWQDEIPCIFISGQNMLHETVRYTKAKFRTYGSQETDIISIIKSITKHAVMITDINKIVYETEKALYLAKQGKKGPVWIDIPLDLQNMRIEPDELEHFEIESLNLSSKDEEIKNIIDSINEAKRPIVLIGNGIRSGDAIEEFYKFIDKTKIPVTYAHSAPDIYGLDNSLSIGAVGSLCGTRAGNFAVQNSDLLIVMGCRMSSMTTGDNPDKFARVAKTIVIDIDKNEHTKNTFHIDEIVLSDVKDVLDKLLKRNIKVTNSKWIDKCKHWKEIFPKCEEKYKNTDRVDLYYLAFELSNTMKNNTIFLCDAGIEELILPSNITFKKGMRCIHPAMQGAMGFALPGAIGATYSSESEVVAVIGDGSIMMNLQELATIAFQKLPIKILIINNNMYSVIRKRQTELFRNRTIGTDFTNGVGCPSFKKIANCFGIPYTCIENSNDLYKKLKETLEMKGTVICEIMAVENQEYLSSSYTRNQNKKIVKRPLEDQRPFLDRELFLSEMIIEPIDQ